MPRNGLNYLAAVVFLFDAFRDWDFGSPDEAVIWFIMALVCVTTALNRSLLASKAA